MAEPSSNPDTGDTPPSMTDSHVQQPLRREFPPDYDLATCTYRHSILAMVPQGEGKGEGEGNDEAEADSAVPVALCHWNPPTVSHVEMATAELPPRLFSVIKDAQPLGTFYLPDDLDVAAALSGLLAAAAAAVPEEGEESRLGGGRLVLELELTPQRLGSLMGRLEVSEGEGSWLRFFSFPLYSDSPQQVLGKGLYPIWKWAKPESIYRKTGSWETSLHEVLDNGEWNGGRNLLLLIRGVSEEKLKAMEVGDGDEPGIPGSPLKDSEG